MEVNTLYWVSGLVTGIMAFWPVMMLAHAIIYKWPYEEPTKEVGPPAITFGDCEFCKELRLIVTAQVEAKRLDPIDPSEPTLPVNGEIL